ncbi:SUKH-4 family immunity protein [Streptomyces purpureus]|uniref:SUKH-4 immunity protein of toxin-antitoxin system n=1 Tax=Streptomyces purpureus TaxID=1951 RepID=A0A918GZ00_9ACTN|nr:SUKH-4 family immunity protein [Streptomyces purpureus]GGT17835.1 hypothetical protein GCM10014713_08240 [Streptomyces purpureus]
MLFSVDHAELVRTVGEDNVHRLSGDVAQAYGFDGATAEFLTEIGIPGDEELELFFGLGPEFDPDRFCSSAELKELGWKVGEEVDGWVRLGNFPVNMVAVDPRTGTVHQFTEGPMTALAIHGDLSSFARTVASLAAYVQSQVDAEERADAAHESRDADVRRIVEDIRARDPLPFENRRSEWHELFENLAAGTY